MYRSGRNPLHKVGYKTESVDTAKSPEQRRLHKAFLRWHDPGNWPLLRDAIRKMGRAELIGDGEQQLIPATQPATDSYRSPRRKNSAGAHKRRKGSKGGKGRALTQHTGLPPRVGN